MSAADLNLRTDVEVEHRNEIFRKMGSFWTEKFGDSDVLKTLVGGMQDQFTQMDIGLKEAIATQTSIAEAPTYHTEIWHQLFLYEADVTIDHPNVPFYSPETGFYGEGLIYGAGVPTLWSWRIPSTLADPKCIANAIENATWVGYRNQAFFFGNGVIGFRVNPFNDSQFTVLDTDRGRAIELWMYVSQWDTRLVGRQYGAPLGIPSLPSSEDYRKLCEGAWQARVWGPCDSAIYKVIAGASGVPLCESDGEVVEIITTAPNGDKVVVTDKRAYRYPSTHIVVVAEGAVLQEGQELTDALKVRHASSVRSGDDDITIPPGFYARAAGVKEAIRFPNKRVSVIAGGLDSSGNRVVSFELHGLGSDLKKYRSATVANGIARTFDTRGPNAPTVPTPAQLRADVNPAVELIAVHTSPHLILLYGDPSRWPARPEQQALLLSQADKVVPPHARVVFQPGTSSESYSSQSYTSSSSSSPSRSKSSWSTASTASTSSASSSRSSRSTGSTASSEISTSSVSSRSVSSVSDVSTSSVSDSSSSSRSFSSQSSQSPLSPSSVSNSSRSTGSTGSSTQSVSTVTEVSSLSSNSSSSSSSTLNIKSTSSRSATESSQSTYVLLSTSSRSSASTAALNSTSSRSTRSSLSSNSSSSSSESLSTLSLSTLSSGSISTQSERSQSSYSNTYSSASSQSTQSRSTGSSKSSRSDSSRSLSTQSESQSSKSGPPYGSMSLSSVSPVTASTASTISTPSSNSSSSSTYAIRSTSSRSSRSFRSSDSSKSPI